MPIFLDHPVYIGNQTGGNESTSRYSSCDGNRNKSRNDFELPVWSGKELKWAYYFAFPLTTTADMEAYIRDIQLLDGYCKVVFCTCRITGLTRLAIAIHKLTMIATQIKTL